MLLINREMSIIDHINTALLARQQGGCKQPSQGHGALGGRQSPRWEGGAPLFMGGRAGNATQKASPAGDVWELSITRIDILGSC